MKMVCGLGCMAAPALLLLAAPAFAQDWAEITFGGDVFDVTGAGELDVGIIDDVLKPYRRAFIPGAGPLKFEVTIDASGAVQDCRFEAKSTLEPAGKSLCAQALRVGRFRQDPLLELDYTRATYRFSIYGHKAKPIRGEAFFRLLPAYPFERRTISFGRYAIPQEGERLTLADLDYRTMSYPRDALQNAVEAEVIVAVTFDAQGTAVRCRPVRSSNTARIAYDTCLEARRGFHLRNVPDPRPFVWITNWRLAE
jgi:hypothetical protein